MQQLNTKPKTVEVPLTQGKVAIISARDAKRVLKHKWYYAKNTGYAVRNVPVEGGKQKTMLMHRFIMEPKDGICVDHRNHDKLDNTRQNLRVSTYKMNSLNRSLKPQKNKKSDTDRGTFRNGKKFVARIGYNWKLIYLGTFDTQEEATAAYQKASEEYYQKSLKAMKKREKEQKQ